MNMLNSIILEGNLVENANVTESVNGLKTVSCTIAVERIYKNAAGENETEVSYFDIECYGEGFAKLQNYFKKDRGLRVVGRLKQKCWKDEEGKSYSKIIIIAEHIEFKPKIKK